MTPRPVMVTPESFFHIAVKVPDIEAAVSFYQQHLNAERIDNNVDVERSEESNSEAVTYVALKIGDKRLYVFDRAPYEATGTIDDVPDGVLHFGYMVDDVAAAVDQLERAGVSIFMKPVDFDDLRIAFFTDPAGTRIELIEDLNDTTE